MTWLTRASLLDTASDLETDLLFQTMEESIVLLTDLVYESDTREETLAHPVSKMWMGYEKSLAAYAAAISFELHTRGVAGQQHLTAKSVANALGDDEFMLPPWLGDADVLRSHRSNLARRWPEQYSELWAQTPARMPYVWPFVDEDGGYGLFVSKYDRDLLASGERVLPASIKKRIENL